MVAGVHDRSSRWAHADVGRRVLAHGNQGVRVFFFFAGGITIGLERQRRDRPTTNEVLSFLPDFPDNEIQEVEDRLRRAIEKKRKPRRRGR